VINLHQYFSDFLKQVITYLILLTISFSYHYETISLITKKCGIASIEKHYSFDCEEKKTENEQKEDTEKDLDFFLALHIKQNHIVVQKYCRSWIAARTNNYASSDFSLGVFYPPELVS
jgi:hypothetical protein